ncbi:hypothetical protein D3C81_110670 [compost metagenome]
MAYSYISIEFYWFIKFMQNQNDPIINNLEQLDVESKQKQENSVLNSVNPDPVEVTDLIVEIGKDIVDFASSVFDNIDINF